MSCRDFSTKLGTSDAYQAAGRFELKLITSNVLFHRRLHDSLILLKKNDVKCHININIAR